MRVLLAEGHEVVRAAIRRFLGELPDITLVSEVVSAANMIPQAREVQPDLVLIDWEFADSVSAKRLHNDDGQARRQLLAVLHALPSHPQIIALSREPEMSQAVLDAGADGFVSKGDSPQHFLLTLHTAATKRRKFNLGGN